MLPNSANRDSRRISPDRENERELHESADLLATTARPVLILLSGEMIHSRITFQLSGRIRLYTLTCSLKINVPFDLDFFRCYSAQKYGSAEKWF